MQAASIQSVNFPTFYMSIFNASTGLLGIVENPDVNDASWTFIPGKGNCPPTATDCYTIVTETKNPSLAGMFMTYSNEYNAICNYGPPNGDLMVTNGGGYTADRYTWLVGALPPAGPVTVTINTATVTNPSVNKKFFGCHHDYGFAQAPRGFYANLVYGASFEKGTCSVDSWSQRVTNGASGGTGSTDDCAFSGKGSMDFNYGTPAPSGGAQVGLVNRGMCGSGMVFEGGKPYIVDVWVWSGGQPTAFVELLDFTTNTSLARQDFQVVSTGPDWGSTWIHYNFTLTPSASTTCTGIPFGSDPTIDCGGDAGPAHVCVRCGGELYVGLSSPGDAKIGYVSLRPGSWGVIQDAGGNDLPVLKSGADVLTQMGVSLIRSGGSVSQSMRWKDWRGPTWNRPSQGQVWGSRCVRPDRRPVCCVVRFACSRSSPAPF